MPTKEEYQKDPERHRAYNREYLKKWRATHPKKKPHTKEWHRKYMNDYYKRPLPRFKLRARQKVFEALRSGKLVRQVCEVPRCTELGEGHHPDYEKPLDVRWLCRSHHLELHEELKKRKESVDAGIHPKTTRRSVPRDVQA